MFTTLLLAEETHTTEVVAVFTVVGGAIGGGLVWLLHYYLKWMRARNKIKSENDRLEMAKEKAKNDQEADSDEREQNFLDQRYNSHIESLQKENKELRRDLGKLVKDYTDKILEIEAHRLSDNLLCEQKLARQEAKSQYLEEQIMSLREEIKQLRSGPDPEPEPS